MPLGPTPISTKKNVPVTLWPDAPDPRTQPGFGAAGMGSALGGVGGVGGIGGIGREDIDKFPKWKDPWGIMSGLAGGAVVA